MPGKKALQSGDTIFEIVLVDATEQPIERPKKRQKRHYCGKKKRHTQKVQLIADLNTKRILAWDFRKGSYHDFQLLKQSQSAVSGTICIVADAGYQGLD